MLAVNCLIWLSPAQGASMNKRRRVVIGNWKMNGRIVSGVQLATDLVAKAKIARPELFDVAVCPPHTILWPVSEVLAGSSIQLGAQDCHQMNHGAYTGDVSAGMILDVGCKYVILGHSERRDGHAESPSLIASKVDAAMHAGLKVVLCIGEQKDIRDSGGAIKFVTNQLKQSLPDHIQPQNLIIAYEPVWAIGTGVTPTLEQIAEMHMAIRAAMGQRGETMQILYGGSVSTQNCAEIFSLEEVDGALVGSASLNSDGFWKIAQACAQI